MSDATSSNDALDTGSYEVLRERLGQQAKALGEAVTALNTRRQEVFGGSEMAILGNARARTANNCVPRDIVQVGGKLLFGYNVAVHLREPTVDDVLGLQRLGNVDGSWELDPAEDDAALLRDPAFVRELGELYRYYKNARLVQLRVTETNYLLAIFQIGDSLDDVRVFHWAVRPDGSVRYEGNRGERHHTAPPSHDFRWIDVTRDHHVAGRFPHVSIDDALFVETLGGDLTIKVENNTASGEGIYREPVEQRDQTLDDARISWAKVGGLYLLKILPYREVNHRYLVFDTRTHRVTRIDAIGHACLRLPEDHGIIFPGGYYLQSGDTKIFEGDNHGLEYRRSIRSPNGEDVLYVFHRRRDGLYKLLPYNLIRKEVSNPIPCHGYSIFDDGTMVIFRATSDEPVRVHPMQIWQTPFSSVEHADRSAPTEGGYLSKLGNAELVRGISDCVTVRRLAMPDAPSRQGFEDLVAACTRALDQYYWLGHAEVGDLAALLRTIRQTGELVVDEFEKVMAIRKRAEEALAEATAAQAKLIRELRPGEWREIAKFMDALTALRRTRGHLITLRELRYMDLAALGKLEEEAVGAFDRVSRATVQFLLDDAALAPLASRIEELHARVDKTERGVAVKELEREVEDIRAGLDVLSEVVASLQVDDAAARAAILERIGEVYARLNRTKAALANRMKEVLGRESRAEFAAQLALLAQSVESALAHAGTPEQCDEQLSRLLVLLEELEARFGELEEYVADLAQKREELYEAFSGKKQRLVEERQRRAGTLHAAATRILEGLGRRARSFQDADTMNAWFASDPMVLKLRDLVERLQELGDVVRAEELSAKLKTARQDALRGLRDRADLFEDGARVIRLGRHRFGVNGQPLELTIVPRGDGMAFHLTGTDFHQPVTDPALEATRAYWDQALISETPEVYRAEYLAATVFFAAERGEGGRSIAALHAAAREGTLLALVREEAQRRYDEGYDRGVHDADAALILEKVLALESTAGLLRYPPRPRALACLAWAYLEDDALRARLRRLGASLGRLERTFGRTENVDGLRAQIEAELGRFVEMHRIALAADELAVAARYLTEELLAPTLAFTTSAEAIELREALLHDLDKKGARHAFEEDVRDPSVALADRLSLARAWSSAFLAQGSDLLGGPSAARRRELAASLDEAAVLLLTDGKLERISSAALGSVVLGGLLGQHPRVERGSMALRLDELLARLDAFVHRRAPGFRAYRELRHALGEKERKRLRIDELMPKVLTSFVRNRLIDEVYLPLIGDNLAKQLGTAGADTRTDRMGMLLLISPPGYGKTTLMEYVASQLGLVFVKVNGPALGHSVTSIDPAEAPNATSRQEVEKINLALEMGNNAMLYLDDIQHTSPELLQKFISLCDAQRRIEGVWNGVTRTYDMRGKRFCVVMAGNPYTESGDKFQIPDMLANRADTYNLGDMLVGKETQFALSYIENALTSSPVLSPIASRSLGDVHKLLRMAQGEEVPTTDLEHGYSAVEVQEAVSVLQKLMKVQKVLGMVNAEYIRSASMEEAFRTEPPFKLQGSYRNMNKLAEKVVSAMNDAELEALIDDHYQGESQTLTTGAEQNLLKLAELRGRMSDAQKARWAEIKREHRRLKTMGGAEDDPVTRMTGTLSGIGAQLEAAIRGVAERIVPAAEADSG
jgi:hypothetical protein